MRRTPSAWTHVGIVTDAGPEAFGAIKGNTNDAGPRNGVEDSARLRSYTTKDFIHIV